MLKLDMFFPENFVVSDVIVEDTGILIELISSQNDCRCPECNTVSRRVHSRYERTIADFPLMGKKVVLHLKTRKFFCDNAQCKRTIFTERYKNFVKTYARKTDRLNKLLEKIAFATSAEIGAKILNTHFAEISSDTLIRIVKNTEINPDTDYELIGIDDWAFKKGNRYGTLICDLKTHKPIAVLEGRDYKTVSEWLKNKKG